MNYRLWEFYYSMLEFALSWNPLQLMADKAYVYSSSEDGAYNTTNTSLLEPSLLEEARELLMLKKLTDFNISIFYELY